MQTETILQEKFESGSKMSKPFVGWMLWILASLIYAHQYFLRVSISGLSDQLKESFHMTTVDLAYLSGNFFITYIVCLPFSGVLLDRYNIKNIFPFAGIVCGFACFGFALSGSSYQLLFWRLIIGGSASCFLIGALLIIREYFKDELFPLLSGLTLTIGLFGGILGEGPLYHLSRYVEWRIIIHGAGLFVMISSIILYVLLLNNNLRRDSSRTLSRLFNDLRIFLLDKNNWLPAIYGGLMLSIVIAFASFWAPPFISKHYHVSPNNGEYYATIIFSGYAIGAPMTALLAQKLGIRVIMIVTSILAIISTFCLVYFQFPLIIMASLLLLQGITVGSFSLTAMAVKQISKPDILASALSFSSLIAQLVGMIILWFISAVIYYDTYGLIFQKKTGSLMVMHQSLYALIGFLCCAVLVGWGIKLPEKR